MPTICPGYYFNLNAMKKSFLSFLCCASILFLQAQNNQWTWTAGENNYAGFDYGNKGVADPMNFPGARAGAATWVDASGNLWLFGGAINTALWKYAPATKMWTWVSGDSTAQRTVYGTRGVAAAANTPPGGSNLISWKDAAGKFWLFSNVLWKYDPLIGQWAWISGDTSNTNAVYGTKGIAAPSNKPGRGLSVEWTDAAGNFWFYGGVLWKYDVAADVWTWVSGDTTATKTVYGQRGIPNSSNTPGTRSGITGWTDNAGKFWLFGGTGTVSAPYLFKSVNHYTGPLNDLWKYDPLNNQWTWMHGDTVLYSGGKSGPKGVAAPDNIPGCRRDATSWKDAAGNLWLFGGYLDWTFISQIPNINPMGDLWKYDPATNFWTFFNQSSSLRSRDSFDLKGVESPSTLPATRYDASGWTDPSGNLWMFGGTTLDLYGNLYYFSMNDLLKYNPNSNMWSLEQEDRSGAPLSIYGTRGVASSVNRPSGRYGAASCTDGAGNLWIFGGVGHQQTNRFPDFLTDLWKQDTAKRWTWAGNSMLANPNRLNAQMWADTSNKLWIYGGNYAASNYSDLWKVDPLNYQWTQVSANLLGTNFGTKGQPAATNKPGQRNNAVTWTDKTGKLWMFGGDASFSGNGGSEMNDTWNYDPATGWWTWISGDNTPGQPAVFGSMGIANAANKPGSRQGAANWTDTAGNIWIFGGLRGNATFLNDLWKYNPATNQWAWMSGDSATNRNSVYGTKGASNAANKPGGRYDAVAWTDKFGMLWLFGGARMKNIPAYTDPGSHLNDLWRYDPATNIWTWMSGDSTINQNGRYGYLGVADSSNKPGARSGAVGYRDKAGNFRLIGGVGYAWRGRSLLNDEWTFSPAAAILPPAQFFDFSAIYQNREALLQWSTSAAPAGAYFIIERSRDGTSYDSIGMVRAVTGNSSTAYNYTFTDPNPFTETNYYRIKQTDPYGRFSHSNVVQLWGGYTGWSYTLSPNPVRNQFKVNIKSEKAEMMQINVRDVAGHLLSSQKQQINRGISVNTIYVQNLAAGTYFLSITAGKITLTKKFVKR